MANYYQPEIECASRDEIISIQNKRLKEQVKHVYANVEYCRKKMDEKGVDLRI